MSRYLLKRLIGLVPVFIGITLVSFFVIHLAPGSPVSAQGAMDPRMTSQAREKLTKLYGLDQPVARRYLKWLKRSVRFDFGESFTDGQRVTVKIARAVPVTLAVNLLSLIIILLAGVPLGVYGAVHARSPGDRLITLATLAGFAIPTFWLSLLCMSFFGVTLRWLPVSGLCSLQFEDYSFIGKLADLARHLALPVAVSSVTGLAGITRFMRSGMLETLKENYIRTARAKGLSEHDVLYRHALRNALLPIITILGLSVPGLLGGSVIFETIFSLPGMGRLFFQSVFARDYPVIMGMLVLGAVLTLLGNLMADLAYADADPRVKLQ